MSDFEKTYENLKMESNKDYILKFNYDSPITGTNAYGEYYLYNFDHEAKPVSVFATPSLHGKLKNYIKGDMVKVRKEEYEAGKKGFVVTPFANTPERTTSDTINAVDSTSSIDARTKDIHKQVCLKLAVQSMGTQETLDFAMVKIRMEGLLNVLEDRDVVS